MFIACYILISKEVEDLPTKSMVLSSKTTPSIEDIDCDQIAEGRSCATFTKMVEYDIPILTKL